MHEPNCLLNTSADRRKFGQFETTSMTMGPVVKGPEQRKQVVYIQRHGVCHALRTHAVPAQKVANLGSSGHGAGIGQVAVREVLFDFVVRGRTVEHRDDNLSCTGAKMPGGVGVRGAQCVQRSGPALNQVAAEQPELGCKARLAQLFGCESLTRFAIALERVGQVGAVGSFVADEVEKSMVCRRPMPRGQTCICALVRFDEGLLSTADNPRTKSCLSESSVWQPLDAGDVAGFRPPGCVRVPLSCTCAPRGCSHWRPS